MQPHYVILLILAVAVAVGLSARWLLRNPRGDVETGIVYRTIQVYVRVFHRMRATGTEHIRAAEGNRPLIVVANHTSGVDPLLVQALCRFEIRWIMASDMRHPSGEWFWKFARIIFVDRNRGEIASIREAVKHLESGGVLGIFPEGGIERPEKQVMLFRAGVGMIIRKTGATVLPFVIEGTPQVDPAWATLKQRSWSSVRVLPPVDYSKTHKRPQEIADDLRSVFLRHTGWPANDNPDAVVIDGRFGVAAQGEGDAAAVPA